MSETTWDDFLEVLKILNCMDMDEWVKALGSAEWPCYSDFDRLWGRYLHHGLFVALCELDTENYNKLMDYADQKRRNR